MGTPGSRKKGCKEEEEVERQKALKLGHQAECMGEGRGNGSTEDQEPVAPSP